MHPHALFQASERFILCERKRGEGSENRNAGMGRKSATRKHGIAIEGLQTVGCKVMLCIDADG